MKTPSWSPPYALRKGEKVFFPYSSTSVFSRAER
jgi:hypothetical protein